MEEFDEDVIKDDDDIDFDFDDESEQDDGPKITVKELLNMTNQPILFISNGEPTTWYHKMPVEKQLEVGKKVIKWKIHVDHHIYNTWEQEAHWEVEVDE